MLALRGIMMRSRRASQRYLEAFSHMENAIASTQCGIRSAFAKASADKYLRPIRRSSSGGGLKYAQCPSYPTHDPHASLPNAAAPINGDDVLSTPRARRIPRAFHPTTS